MGAGLRLRGPRDWSCYPGPSSSTGPCSRGSRGSRGIAASCPSFVVPVPRPTGHRHCPVLPPHAPSLTPPTLGLWLSLSLSASRSFTDSICLSLSLSSPAHSSRLWAQSSFPAPGNGSLYFGQVAAPGRALISSSVKWKEYTHASKTPSLCRPQAGQREGHSGGGGGPGPGSLGFPVHRGGQTCPHTAAAQDRQHFREGGREVSGVFEKAQAGGQG